MTETRLLFFPASEAKRRCAMASGVIRSFHRWLRQLMETPALFG
jgi:hypothetical protein